MVSKTIHYSRKDALRRLSFQSTLWNRNKTMNLNKIERKIKLMTTYYCRLCKTEFEADNPFCKNCMTERDTIIVSKEPQPKQEESVVDDPVNHPSHYTSHPSGIECIDITRHHNFNIGNAIKYL